MLINTKFKEENQNINIQFNQFKKENQNIIKVLEFLFKELKNDTSDLERRKINIKKFSKTCEGKIISLEDIKKEENIKKECERLLEMYEYNTTSFTNIKDTINSDIFLLREGQNEKEKEIEEEMINLWIEQKDFSSPKNSFYYLNSIEAWNLTLGKKSILRKNFKRLEKEYFGNLFDLKMDILNDLESYVKLFFEIYEYLEDLYIKIKNFKETKNSFDEIIFSLKNSDVLKKVRMQQLRKIFSIKYENDFFDFIEDGLFYMNIIDFKKYLKNDDFLRILNDFIKKDTNKNNFCLDVEKIFFKPETKLIDILRIKMLKENISYLELNNFFSRFLTKFNIFNKEISEEKRKYEIYYFYKKYLIFLKKNKKIDKLKKEKTDLFFKIKELYDKLYGKFFIFFIISYSNINLFNIKTNTFLFLIKIKIFTIDDFCKLKKIICSILYKIFYFFYNFFLKIWMKISSLKTFPKAFMKILSLKNSLKSMRKIFMRKIL